ncbi:MAG: hypothetical protein Q4C70_04270 [Planctomycetia bacterium]|nr:hypothetical protein [Planctomycetia bacterium]
MKKTFFALGFILLFCAFCSIGNGAEPEQTETKWYHSLCLKAEDLSDGLDLSNIPQEEKNSYVQVLCNKENNKKFAQITYTQYPDTEFAHARTLWWLNHVLEFFKPSSIEERTTLGLREEDLCFNYGRLRQFWIQTGRISVCVNFETDCTFQETNDRVSLLKTIVQRCYEAEPHELVLQESQKTLSLKIEETTFQIQQPYRLEYPLLTPEGKEPYCIRLVFLRATPTDFRQCTGRAWPTEHYCPGGFECETNLDAIRWSVTPDNPVSFYSHEKRTETASNPYPNVYAYFLCSGKHRIRCYHLDESGNCIAWGEMEVEVQPGPRRFF